MSTIIIPNGLEIEAFAPKDWYDGYIEKEESMKFYLISDTHFNHAKLETYCQRPANFTELLIKNWRRW